MDNKELEVHSTESSSGFIGLNYGWVSMVLPAASARKKVLLTALVTVDVLFVFIYKMYIII